VISLTDVFDAASRRHNDVILLPAICRVSGNDCVPAGQYTGTLRRARAVELLRQETPNFLPPNLWPPNIPDFQGRFYVRARGHSPPPMLATPPPQIFCFQQQKYAFLKSRLFLYCGEINTRIS